MKIYMMVCNNLLNDYPQSYHQQFSAYPDGLADFFRRVKIIWKMFGEVNQNDYLSSAFISQLESVEQFSPESPIDEGPDGVWVTQKQYKEMAFACLMDLIDLDYKTIIETISISLTNKNSIYHSISQIAKTVKGQILKYASCGLMGVCVLYFNWGVCMKEKLDNL